MSRSTTTSATASQAGKATTTSQTQAQACAPLEKVAMLAYQKWVKAGCKHGCDKQHWFEAEAELKAEMTRAGGKK